MPPEYLTAPGLPVLSASAILDWYNGPLLFRATGDDGSAWLCSWVDMAATPDRVEWTRYVDVWAYARHDAKTVDDIMAGRRYFRDLFTAASELWRVELTWLSTGGPLGAGKPTATATRSTPDTIVDGWLPPEYYAYEETP